MTTRTYTQFDRELLLSSLLDITVDQIQNKLNTMTGDEVDALGDAINTHFGHYFSEMRKGPEEGDGQIMFQSVSLMSDSTLHRIVQTFGEDPLTDG